MFWNCVNKLMIVGFMVDGVLGEIFGVEGKLYVQLLIDIEYYGVMYVVKMFFFGCVSFIGKCVGWCYSYNLIFVEQCDFILVECVCFECCIEQVQNGELDFFFDELDELEKQCSEVYLLVDVYLIV